MRTGLAAPVGLLKAMGSLFAGATVIGVAVAYAGPFLNVIAVIGSIIYGTIISLRVMAPKKFRENMKSWNA
jgi:predicted lipid-binding transport protein (Tim44 family)